MCTVHSEESSVHAYGHMHVIAHQDHRRSMQSWAARVLLRTNPMDHMYLGWRWLRHAAASQRQGWPIRPMDGRYESVYPSAVYYARLHLHARRIINYEYVILYRLQCMPLIDDKLINTRRSSFVRSDRIKRSYTWFCTSLIYRWPDRRSISHLQYLGFTWLLSSINCFISCCANRYARHCRWSLTGVNS
jgi:hypothetical protein